MQLLTRIQNANFIGGANTGVFILYILVLLAFCHIANIVLLSSYGVNIVIYACHSTMIATFFLTGNKGKRSREKNDILHNLFIYNTNVLQILA